MADSETRESIDAKLQAFLRDLQSPDPPSPTPDDGSLLVLSGHIYDNKEKEAIRAILPQYKTIELEDCHVLRDGHINHRVLYQVTIHNSNLENCTLIECIIYQSNIKSSTLKSCRIQKEAGGGNDASSAPYLIDCKIEEGAIFDAYIYNSTLNEIKSIENCRLESSSIVTSGVSDSFIRNCGVHKSELVNCDVVSPDASPGWGVTQRENGMAFRTFPVEIRKMVYSLVVATERLATNFIAALRPDALLHAEVLEVLFQEHVFVLSERNHEAVARSNKKVTKRVKKLHLDMEGKWFPTKDVSMYFPTDTMISNIEMKIEGEPSDIDHFYNVTKLWFKHFGTVAKFKVTWTNTGAHSPGNPPKALLGCIAVANKRLRNEGMLVKGKVKVPKQDVRSASGVGYFAVPAREERVVKVLEVDTFTWTWSAGKGKVLLWNW